MVHTSIIIAGPAASLLPCVTCLPRLLLPPVVIDLSVGPPYVIRISQVVTYAEQVMEADCQDEQYNVVRNTVQCTCMNNLGSIRFL